MLVDGIHLHVLVHPVLVQYILYCSRSCDDVLHHILW